jgi:uncharacterized protein (DUF4415 family)
VKNLANLLLTAVVLIAVWGFYSRFHHHMTHPAFARAVARKGLKPVPKKALLSLRIDSDVIEWFKEQGAGYQSRMNALLRAYMEAHK